MAVQYKIESTVGGHCGFSLAVINNFGSLGFRVVFVAGALPPHPHKELSFLDLVHLERCAFKKQKFLAFPFFKKGIKRA